MALQRGQCAPREISSGHPAMTFSPEVTWECPLAPAGHLLTGPFRRGSLKAMALANVSAKHKDNTLQRNVLCSTSNLHPISLRQGIELRVELIAGGPLSVSWSVKHFALKCASVFHCGLALTLREGVVLSQI